MKRRDPDVYLVDIVTAATLIEGFVQGKTLDDYAADRMLSSAVERQLEIVGEACNRLLRADQCYTESLRGAREVIGLRNVIAHGYDRVSDRLIWSAITDHLPALASAARELLGEHGTRAP